jgi:hypothetical protein
MEVQVIFIFDKWSRTDDKDVHVLITTDLTMSVRSAILTYLLRWGIEESFRELKDTFCFDQYQVHHQEQIQRHWDFRHFWLGHLPTGLSKTAAYLRYSRSHLKLLENANKPLLHLSSSIQHSFSQRTKTSLLLYTKLNLSVLRKNSQINKVLYF